MSRHNWKQLVAAELSFCIAGVVSVATSGFIGAIATSDVISAISTSHDVVTAPTLDGVGTSFVGFPC
jgi:hypothetical protein